MLSGAPSSPRLYTILILHVRVEYLQEPELYIPEVLARVKPEYMQQRYALPDYDPTCHPLWQEMTEQATEKQRQSEVIAQPDPTLVEVPTEAAKGGEGTPEQEEETTTTLSRWPADADLFLQLVARKTGKLLKGGEPDIITTAKRILNDFQRGKLPYFVRPPPLEEEEGGKNANNEDVTAGVDDQQALGEIFEGEETSIADESTNTESLPATGLTETESTKRGDEEVSEDEGKEHEEDADGSFDLAPHSEDELQESQEAEDEDVEGSGGLSKSRRRQLERALRRQKGRAGRHFYEEVNVKNRHLRPPPQLSTAAAKRFKKSL
ncbi:unnamed protein product [Schistocephalus solidus]|uniref:Uncharacterized protein n=1 Tax=Schistocephalus solidus TaxID=70667 RepID=A0A183TF40_SCHSO|nr:unnamed protein product [Schistocephalus solidus]